MDYDNFDQQLHELLDAERKKAPYIEYSLSQQHDLVLNDFYRYYAELVPMDEYMLDALDEEDLFDDGYIESPFQQRLNECVDDLVVKYELPLEGTVKISGTGLYVGATQDDERVGFGVLESGYMIGEVERYAIVPVPSQAQRNLLVQDDEYGEGGEIPEPSNIPGVWQLLRGVTLYDESGQEVLKMEEVHVPIGEANLQFALLEYQGDRLLEVMPASEDTAIDIEDCLKGEFISQMFMDAENYLNYEPYAEDELRTHREQYQQDLSLYTMMVDREALLNLSALQAVDIHGDRIELTHEAALYIDPVITKVNDSWRIAHAFEVILEDKIHLVHVLPEDIIKITS